MAKIMAERVPARGIQAGMAAALSLAIVATVLGALALVRQSGISGVGAEAQQLQFLPSTTHFREAGAVLPALPEVGYYPSATHIIEGQGWETAEQAGSLSPTFVREGMGWATSEEVSFSPSTGIREGRGWPSVGEIQLLPLPSTTFFRESPR